MYRLLVVVLVSLLMSACSVSCELSSRPTDAETSTLQSANVPVTDEIVEVVVRGACPSSMQHVKGNYCPQVEQTCAEWADEDKSPTANSGIGPLRCLRFSLSKCVSKERKPLNFCMDRYEWPNKKGELPPVGMTWHEAKRSCESVGKRLCTAQEWTFACEGEDVKPYMYGDGMTRDNTACNIDKPSMDPSTPKSEWPKHYRAVPSGSMERCVSWAGVHDMSGNVDEWVLNEGGRTDGDPYFSGLKGGYWSKVRARCRPMTTVHGPNFSFYQIGFRCCKDVGN